MDDKKVIYQNFHTKNSLPIFCSPWWLDITCGPSNWNVAISHKAENVFAVMPYYVHKTAAGIELIQPKLSKFLGIYFEYPEGQSSYKRYSFEKQHTQTLIDQLPKFGSFKHSFYYNYQNWLPLYWNGYKQTTNYSYSLETNHSLDELFSGFKSSIRRSIRKAENEAECFYEADSAIFFRLAEDTFKRQGKSVPYSKELLEKLVTASKKHNNGELIVAKNKSGIPLAGGFFVWDTERLYYLAGGVNSDKSDSGAMSLVMWNGIQLAHKLGVTFDFEGSMVESIENFFRSFGSEQTAYFQISKVPSKKLQLKYFIKSLLK
jgi:hypothetical protein